MRVVGDSQGSPQRATLGWLIQSRWDWAAAGWCRDWFTERSTRIPHPPFMIGIVPRDIMDLCHGASWDCAVIAWNGAARSARRERQRRSIIQPRVVSFQRNYPGSIPPNQTANPERVESIRLTAEKHVHFERRE